MIVIVFLGIFASVLVFSDEYVLATDSQSDNNDEEFLVVNKLASIIREEQQKLSDHPDTFENEKVSSSESQKAAPVPITKNSSFKYEEPEPIKRKDVTILNKQPFAVPPSDFRYFQKDFSLSANNVDVDLHQNEQKDENIKITSAYGTHRLGSHLENVVKTDSKKGDTVEHAGEEEVQRRKVYSHLMLNPSFIPYGGHANSIRPQQGFNIESRNSTNLLAITYGTVCALLVITTVGAIMIYRKLKKKVKDAEEVDYPAYGVTGPSKEMTAPTGDRHLAHSAQMYHYQHQKQQIIAMEKGTTPVVTRKRTDSGSEEDEMTVYECPGLAPVTGELEVKNPMFQEEDEIKSSSTPKESKLKKTHLNVNNKTSKK